MYKKIWALSLVLITTGVTPPAYPSNVSECRTSLSNVPEKQVSGPSAAETVVKSVMTAAGIEINGSSPSDITVKDKGVYTRLISDPKFELGETYMDGLWDSPSIDQVTTKLYLAQQHNGTLKTFAPLWRTPFLALEALVKNIYRYQRDLLTNRQTRTRSTTVAKEHYDAGNELYRLMLDPTLTYTSGVWAPGYTLEDAQNAKYDLICRKLDLKPGQHVLDIGSGFGGFARFAAKNYGAQVTGITISNEQLKAARALSTEYKKVNFIYSDYRDIQHRFAPDTFDHVVSIEMIEAVGPKNLEKYFASASSALKEGGRFVIQAIANNKDVVNTNPWFSKYIFQDGVAPSTNQVDRAAQKTFGSAVHRHRITENYDKTLLAWHENFAKAWPELKNQYGPRFKRMWDFYLLSVAGGFRSKELQLDQSIFIKQRHHPETSGAGIYHDPVAVRDFQKADELPSLSRLEAMRATDEEKERAKAVIAQLEHEKVEVKSAMVPRPLQPRVPLDKNARIAVIGAGPSGLSSALELQRLGYKNVVVFEKESEAGGKTHTVDINGRSHDLGATMGLKVKYAGIEKLAKQSGQKTIPFPEEVYYDLQGGVPEKAPSFSLALKKKFQGLLYLIHHIRLAGFGERGLEVPPSELADPFYVVMNRAGLGFFGDELKTYNIGYGYGGPETPAVYPLRMLDGKAIVGAAISNAIMWQNGTQPIWKDVARRLNVRTNTAIEHVQRQDAGVDLYLKDNPQPEHFDKMIIAVDPQAALNILDATPEERSLFSKVQYMPYATFAVRVEGLADQKSQVGYIKENMTLERQGHPMAWIKRYPNDNVFVFHLFAPQGVPDSEIMANITGDMQRLGATKLTLITSHRWPFFPHVDSTAIRENHFFERARRLQGRNHTVFINEALAMSTMPDSANQGIKAAQRLASGEYHE